MSDIREARELETLRMARLVNKLNQEQEKEIVRINSDMASRGLFNSGPRLKMVVDAQANRVQQIIDGRIATRRELARSFPAFCRKEELDELVISLERVIAQFAETPDKDRIVQQEPVKIAMIKYRQQIAARLRSHAKTEAEILGREVALGMHDEPKPTGVSVNTGGGPALVNLGAIYGDVEQVINLINETGQRELADVLQQLAKAISEADALADERAELLQQVRFVAEQAAVPPQSRQTSVVKAVWVSLQARLHDVAAIAQILSVAGPVVAHHYGFQWPM